MEEADHAVPKATQPSQAVLPRPHSWADHDHGKQLSMDTTTGTAAVDKANADDTILMCYSDNAA
jgi:hypothetical protein